MTFRTVVFDLGGVLIDWDPRHLYRTVFDDEDEMERFLAEVCTLPWHFRHDAGVPFDETIPALVAEFPEHEDLIRMWASRHIDMVAGAVPGVPGVLRELHERGTRLYALTNMPAECWEPIRAMFEWFDLFDGAVVSGHEKVVKPDPAIYRILVDRFDVDPATTAFVDDRQVNVDAATALGFTGIVFTDAASLRDALQMPR
jgi:2-haloacid dehalogenase